MDENQDPGSGISIPGPQHWLLVSNRYFLLVLIISTLLFRPVSDLVSGNGDIELSAVHQFLADEEFPGQLTTISFSY
jgi:hypothetical protein